MPSHMPSGKKQAPANAGGGQNIGETKKAATGEALGKPQRSSMTSVKGLGASRAPSAKPGEPDPHVGASATPGKGA